MRVSSMAMVFALVFLTVLGGWSFAQSNATAARKEIQKLYDQEKPWMVSTAGSHDEGKVTTYWETLTTPDFESLEKNGTKKDLKQWIAGYLHIMPNVRNIHRYVIKVEAITMQGDNTAEVVQHYDIAFNYADSKDGMIHLVAWKGIDKDTWVKSRNRWREHRKVAVETYTSTDGKPDNPASVAAQSQQELRQIEQAMAEQLVKGGSMVWERYLADTYQFTGSDGAVLNRTAFINLVKSGKLKYESCQIDEMMVRSYGNTALVTFCTTSKATYNGMDISGKERWLDVLVRTDDGWKLVGTQGTKLQ